MSKGRRGGRVDDPGDRGADSKVRDNQCNDSSWLVGQSPGGAGAPAIVQRVRQSHRNRRRVAKFAVIPGGLTEDSGSSSAAPVREESLLADLYSRHAGAVYGRCRWLLRDEEAAKDATQDVFAKALRALPEFRGAASPTTWLLRIATHHCLNELRASRALWKDEVERLSEMRSDEGVVPERRELVRVLLARAEPEEQEVAVMYFVDELTQTEIADATGRSLPTVRKRLRKFLARARKALVEAIPGVTFPEEDE